MRKDGTDVAAVGLPAGTKIGKYEIVERYAMGGQAIVYKAYDSLLDRHVAIKQISSHLAEDEQFLERFRREAQILAKLGAEQPCIVTIHDLIEDQRGLFIVMEFVQGNSLATVIAETNGPTEPKAALQVLWRLAGALHAVHAAGIIHRDIKPANIIIGEGLWPKIMDFGVAASLSGQTSMVLGTTRYMAPELFGGGTVDGRADMYSLGFIMYELLAGKPKFDEIFADVIRDERSATMRWMKWHGNASVEAPLLHEVNPAIPVPLSHVVARMIAKDPDHRFESMEALGKAIKGAFSPRSRGGGPAAAVAPPPRRAAAAVGVAAGAGEMMAEGGIELTAADEPTFDPEPTVRLPKSTLSMRTKLILLGTIAAGVLALVITISVKRSQERAAFDTKVNALYKPIAEAYDESKWQATLDAYKEFKAKASSDPEDGDDMAKTVWMARARFMAKLSEGHVAVMEKKHDWLAAAFKAADKAKKNREYIEEQFADSVDNPQELDNWLDVSNEDLRDFNDQYLASRSMQDLMTKVAEAEANEEYKTALALLSPEALEEQELNLSAAQSKTIAEWRVKIIRNQFMAEFRTINTKAEELNAAGKLDAARIEFERALALIRSDRAKGIVAQERRDESIALLKTKIITIEHTQRGQALWARLKAERANKDPLKIIEAIDAIVLYQPGDPQNKALIAEKNAIVLAQKRSKLLAWFKANAQASQNTAVLKAKQWLADHPGDTEVRSILTSIEKGISLANEISNALRTYRKQQWTAAIPLLTGLLKYSSTAIRMERQKVRDMIRECEVQIAWADAEATRLGGDLQGAIPKYEKVLRMRPDWRQKIMAIVDNMTQKMSFKHNIDRAKAAFAAKEWSKAIRYAIAAREYKAASIEALTIITNSRYEQQMGQGRARVEQKDWPGAKAYFTVASKIKETAEVKKLITLMEAKIKGESP